MIKEKKNIPLFTLLILSVIFVIITSVNFFELQILNLIKLGYIISVIVLLFSYFKLNKQSKNIE